MKQERGCCTAPSGDTQPAYRPTLRILLKIKDSPGTKSAGNEFSLSVGKRTFAKILLIPAKPILRIRYGGEFPSGLRPSTAVQDGTFCALLESTYPSPGFRFAAFPYGEGAEHSGADEVTPTGRARLRPPSFGRSSRWCLLHFVRTHLSLTGLSVR